VNLSCEPKPKRTPEPTGLDRLGWAISRAGERWGLDGLVYNPLVFLYYHEHARESGPKMFAALKRVFPEARRYVDLGAGSGAFAAAGQRLGLSVTACERSLFGRAMARCQGVQALALDLGCDPPAALQPDGFDIAYSFEVAEHVTADLGERLVEFLARLAPVAVFSGARPGQHGQGHVNEQPREYWVERFARNGMVDDVKSAAALVDLLEAAKIESPWLIENLGVYRRDLAARDTDAP
jgi:SAM-dependent methyltransferase